MHDHDRHVKTVVNENFEKYLQTSESQKHVVIYFGANLQSTVESASVRDSKTSREVSYDRVARSEEYPTCPKRLQ